MNKYFLIPVAACVATISLVPVTIHAQDWTETFKTENEKKVSLDYKFTVTFNDVPTKDLIKEIVAVKDGKRFTTNVSEYVKGQKYVHVTVDGLQYNTAYELQVHLANGSKYKLDFTTEANPAAEEAETLINTLYVLLENYAATTDYLMLENSLLYQNASDKLTTYETDLFLGKNISSQTEAMKATIEDVKNAIEVMKSLHTKIKEAALIVEKGPYQLDELEFAFDDFLWGLEGQLNDWTNADNSLLTFADQSIANLTTMAKTNPQKAELLLLAEEVSALLETYKNMATFLPSTERTNYYFTGNALVKDANDLQTSADDAKIQSTLDTMQEFIDWTEDYLMSLEELGEFYTGAKQSSKTLVNWVSLFPTLNTDINLINSTLSKINSELMANSYLDLSTNVSTYYDLLNNYASEDDLNMFLDDYLMVEYGKYEEYYNELQEKDESFLESNKYLAFEVALNAASMYDVSDAAGTIALFQALQKAYKAL